MKGMVKAKKKKRCLEALSMHTNVKEVLHYQSPQGQLKICSDKNLLTTYLTQILHSENSASGA